MADPPALQAQYGAIIDGIALLKDMQPSYRSLHVARVPSAVRGASGRAASPADPYQRSRPMRPSSRVGTAASLESARHSADSNSAATDSLSGQGLVLQPSAGSHSQTKLTRPASQERVSSAWGLSQRSMSGHQQRSKNAPSTWTSSGVVNQTDVSTGRAASGHKAQAWPSSRQVTAPQVTRAEVSLVQVPSVVCSATSFRPTSAQRQSPAADAARPASRQEHQKSASASKVDAYASRAIGMTLSQYMSQMPSREAAAGESWARPVSASLTAEDCRPPSHSQAHEDLSSIEDDESPGWRDDDQWDTSPVPQAPSPPGPEDTTDLSPSSRHLQSARGNGLDLRPATAAGVFSSPGITSASQDAHATRETDLGSLSAQLFAPRPQTQGGCFRPPSRRLSRPSTAQRAATRQTSGSEQTLHGHNSGFHLDEAAQQAPGLVVRGGRKVQSARPSERDERPPSRQKPPPEALHLFQPMHGSSSGGFAPSPVFRAAAPGTTRPSTSASIMQQPTAPRFKPSVLHTGRMTLEDLQKLSDAAVSNSQAIAAGGERAQIRSRVRPPSARPPSAK